MYNVPINFVVQKTLYVCGYTDSVIKSYEDRYEVIIYCFVALYILIQDWLGPGTSCDV